MESLQVGILFLCHQLQGQPVSQRDERRLEAVWSEPFYQQKTQRDELMASFGCGLHAQWMTLLIGHRGVKENYNLTLSQCGQMTGWGCGQMTGWECCFCRVHRVSMVEWAV